MDAELAAMYGAVAKSLQQGVGASQSGFRTAQSQIGSAYDQMTAALTRQANATAGGMVNEFNMLGIGAANDSATQALRNQLNEGLLMGSRRRASELSGLAQQGAAYNRAGQESIGNLQQSGVQARADFRSKLEEILAQLQGEVALGRSQVDTERVRGETELGLMRQEMADRAAARAEQNRQDPLEFLRAQLMGLEIMQKQKDLQQGPERQPMPWEDRGQGALTQFMNQPSNWWERRAGPKFQGALQDIIDYSSDERNLTRFGAAGIRDPYNIALSRVSRAPSYINDDALRLALQIFYGEA